MKNILVFTVVALLACSFVSVARAAATPTPAKLSPTPTPQNILEKQISNLKDKIASRVAELKLVDKRGIIGTVTDVNLTQITLTDIKGNTRFVDVDELTKFSSPTSKSSFGISDITKGTKLGILGLYNKESRRILARFVAVVVIPTELSGGVATIDKTNFNITVLTAEKKSYKVTVENVTKTYSYDGLLLAKAGFSKITQAERIVVIGFPDVKDPKTIIPTRIILFPTLPIDPSITILKPQDLDLQGTVVPSTGSGKKLTPLTK